MLTDAPVARLVGVAMAALVASCNAAAAPATPAASHGQRLAERHCATCHALSSAMPSPLADAPSFPRLRVRYTAFDMATVLARRMTEFHPRMPLVAMDPDEMNAFLAYWEDVPPAAGAGDGRPGPTDSVAAGRAIVIRDCGGCHATGVDGPSAFSPAPPFRVLGARYDLEGLAEALAEGISVGHPAMPERAYPGDQVAAIIAYLKSVQPAAQGAEPKPSRIEP